jgi:hypothetical protein
MPRKIKSRVNTSTLIVKAHKKSKPTMNKGNNGVHLLEMNMNVELSVSMIGSKPKRAALNLLKETTDLVLADLERDSKFFNENPPMALPEFDKTGEWRY